MNDNGLLLRQWRNRTVYDVIDQIVLPNGERSKELKIVQDIPAADHLGMTKTKRLLCPSHSQIFSPNPAPA